MRSDFSGVTHRLKKKKKKRYDVMPLKFILLVYIKEQGQTCKYTILQAMAPYGGTVCT